MTWLETSYIPYLLALVAAPLLVRWRWGLAASLVATVAEVALVALVFYLLDAYRVFPDPYVGEPPARAPMEILRRAREQQAIGFLRLIAWGMIPAIAALMGGTLALLWSAARAIRQSRMGERAGKQQ